MKLRTVRELCTKDSVYRIEATPAGNLQFNKYDRSGNLEDSTFILPCNKKQIEKKWKEIKKIAF